MFLSLTTIISSNTIGTPFYFQHIKVEPGGSSSSELKTALGQLSYWFPVPDLHIKSPPQLLPAPPFFSQVLAVVETFKVLGPSFV